MRLATTFKEQSCQPLYRVEDDVGLPQSDWMGFAELMAWAQLHPNLAGMLVMPPKDKLQ